MFDLHLSRYAAHRMVGSINHHYPIFDIHQPLCLWMDSLGKNNTFNLSHRKKRKIIGKKKVNLKNRISLLHIKTGTPEVYA